MLAKHADPVVVPDDERMRGRRPCAHVDRVDRFARFAEQADDPHDFVGDRFRRFVGRCADVGSGGHELCQLRVGKRGLARLGFVREHIQSDAQTLPLDRFDQRLAIDDLAARGIDENGAVLACASRNSRPTRLFVSGAAATWIDTASLQPSHVQRAGTVRDAQLVGQRFGQAATPGHDLHPEPVRAPDNFLADHADAEDAERPAPQAARLAVFLLAPLAAAQIVRGVDDAAVTGDEQSDRQFGNRGAVLAGTVGDVNPALVGGLHVDRVDARSGPHDQ